MSSSNCWPKRGVETGIGFINYKQKALSHMVDLPVEVTFLLMIEFIMEKDRKPILDIPSLTNFELKPYVAYLTPKVDKKTIPSP